MPVEGAIFKVEWLHYWHPTNEDHAARIYRLPQRKKLRIFQGWDLAISEDASADWTVGLTLGVAEDGACYVLDYYRAHIDFPAQVKQVEAQALAWKPYKITSESNAYQRALPQWLRQGHLPVVEFKQSKDKVLRLTELAHASRTVQSESTASMRTCSSNIGNSRKASMTISWTRSISRFSQ